MTQFRLSAEGRMCIGGMSRFIASCYDSIPRFTEGMIRADWIYQEVTRKVPSNIFMSIGGERAVCN